MSEDFDKLKVQKDRILKKQCIHGIPKEFCGRCFPKKIATVDSLQDELSRTRAALKEALKDVEAIRALMNCYNVGGWTDAIAPMKRALAAEQRVRELEKLSSNRTGGNDQSSQDTPEN